MKGDGVLAGHLDRGGSEAGGKGVAALGVLQLAVEDELVVQPGKWFGEQVGRRVHRGERPHTVVAGVVPETGRQRPVSLMAPRRPRRVRIVVADDRPQLAGLDAHPVVALLAFRHQLAV